jgi:hypothetical protein
VAGLDGKENRAHPTVKMDMAIVTCIGFLDLLGARAVYSLPNRGWIMLMH